MEHLNEQQIREIVRDENSKFLTKDEMFNLIKSDRFTFEKLVQFLDGRNIQFGRTNGTKIGTATDQLLAFYGVTPVNQPATVSDPSGQAADLDSEARTAINALIDRLQELGLIA